MTITLIKLGGSLITDKTIASSYNADVVEQLGNEIRDAISAKDLNLLIGHGSGSFGHMVAKQYGTINGVRNKNDWIGFAKVANVAAQLNHLVTNTLSEVGLNVFSVQPSASAISEQRQLTSLALNPIKKTLEQGLIPIVYGDVSLDVILGATIISTETIFKYLVDHLDEVKNVILVGSVDGVLDSNQHVIPHISPSSFATVKHTIGASYGTDVTGGMYAKVRDMLTMAEAHPKINIRIINGTKPNVLKDTLMQTGQHGTIISSD